MLLLRTLCLSFSMYSRIPMPNIEYTEKDMRYIFLCFPIVGAVIGLTEMLLFLLCEKCGFSSIFYASIATAIPFFVTGGFHMDGFMDTIDALSSFGNREKKLEILKDSHVGAFAVIWCGVYLILNFGAYHELGTSLNITNMTSVSFIYVISRIVSALAAMTFPSIASNSTVNSSLAGVKKASAKAAVKAGLIIYLVTAAGAVFILNWKGGIVLTAALGLSFLYYYKMSKKQFGGITGDLSGWYLQVCELVMLLALAAIL